ncbi:MAG: hypothetical protein LAO09_09630 [Acidobacteriia bacterium]|nr:hypothetical protein [Terriglobia bacterium]
MHYGLYILLAVAIGAVAFLLCFLIALCRDATRASRHRSGRGSSAGKGTWAATVVVCTCVASGHALSLPASDSTQNTENQQAMQQRISKEDRKNLDFLRDTTINLSQHFDRQPHLVVGTKGRLLVGASATLFSGDRLCKTWFGS